MNPQPLDLSTVEEYAKTAEVPNVAREYLQALVEEVKWMRRLSESQEEAMGMMERGAM